MLIVTSYTQELDWFKSFYCAVLTIVPILLVLTVESMGNDIYIVFLVTKSQNVWGKNLSVI